MARYYLAAVLFLQILCCALTQEALAPSPNISEVFSQAVSVTELNNFAYNTSNNATTQIAEVFKISTAPPLIHQVPQETTKNDAAVPATPANTTVNPEVKKGDKKNGVNTKLTNIILVAFGFAAISSVY